MDNTAAVLGDCPFAVADVGFDAVVWQPAEGHKLGEQDRGRGSHIQIR